MFSLLVIRSASLSGAYRLYLKARSRPGTPVTVMLF